MERVINNLLGALQAVRQEMDRTPSGKKFTELMDVEDKIIRVINKCRRYEGAPLPPRRRK